MAKCEYDRTELKVIWTEPIVSDYCTCGYYVQFNVLRLDQRRAAEETLQQHLSREP